MISENIAHDTIVLNEKYDNLAGVTYVNVTYDEYKGAGDKKTKVGEKICRYAQKNIGVLPRILQHLLTQRKNTRKKMQAIQATSKANAADCAFLVAVLDGLQLAYKVRRELWVYKDIVSYVFQVVVTTKSDMSDHLPNTRAREQDRERERLEDDETMLFVIDALIDELHTLTWPVSESFHVLKLERLISTTEELLGRTLLTRNDLWDGQQFLTVPVHVERIIRDISLHERRHLG